MWCVFYSRCIGGEIKVYGKYMTRQEADNAVNQGVKDCVFDLREQDLYVFTPGFELKHYVWSDALKELI